MRRMASGCTTEAHQMYSLYMSKLSACIFEWDNEDLQRLCAAKRAELAQAGLTGLSEGDIQRRLSRKELALHCRRSTRGVDETTNLIDQLIAVLDSDAGKDTLGVPLLDHDRIQALWKQQRQHIKCIQDPPGIQLYTKTGSLMKGRIQLPVYRCARGSTSLESFHNHLARFIPG
jgi:hypothetical protein